MNCEKYTSLTPIEKVAFIGELIHAVQSDDELFNHAQSLIGLAVIKGLFDGVVINPPINSEYHAPDTHGLPAQ